MILPGTILPEAENYTTLLGIVVSDDSDKDVLRVPFSPNVEGQYGFVHGGAIAGLLEATAYRCLYRHIDPTAAIRPVTMNIDYLRAARIADTFATGTIKFRSKRTFIVESKAWQTDPHKSVAEGRWYFLVG